MRAAVTFDTLEYMDELKKSGMKQEEAEAITKATARAFVQMMETKDLCTKSDLKREINDLKVDLMKFINENTWKTIGIIVTLQMVGFGLFGVLRYFVKI